MEAVGTRRPEGDKQQPPPGRSGGIVCQLRRPRRQLHRRSRIDRGTALGRPPRHLAARRQPGAGLRQPRRRRRHQRRSAGAGAGGPRAGARPDHRDLRRQRHPAHLAARRRRLRRALLADPRAAANGRAGGGDPDHDRTGDMALHGPAAADQGAPGQSALRPQLGHPHGRRPPRRPLPQRLRPPRPRPTAPTSPPTGCTRHPQGHERAAQEIALSLHAHFGIQGDFQGGSI